MLAFCSAMHAVTRASEPGRSRTSTSTRARRPARTMPRSMISESISGSMLPPAQHQSHLSCRAKRARLRSRAASGAAPAPSTTVFSISSSSTIASSISPSSTSRISATFFAMISRVSAPGLLHRDAVGDGGSGELRRGSLHRVVHRGKAHHLHAHHFDARASRAFAAMAMPEMSPPPPIATTSTSSSGCAASISSAAGALPRDDLLVVVGMHEREAALGREPRSHGPWRSSKFSPFEDHLGAEALGLLDLHVRRVARHHDDRGDAEAVRVVGHALRVVARRAGDHALGGLGAHRGDASLLSAPRSLNDAVNWWFSNLR